MSASEPTAGEERRDATAAGTGLIDEVLSRGAAETLSHHFSAHTEQSRAPIYGMGRAIAFTDALFSIVITILVIPLKVDEHESKDSKVMDVLDMLRLLQFFFSYCVIFIYWDAHQFIFSLFQKIDTLMVVVNGTLLAVLAFVPYTSGCWLSFPQSFSSTLLFVSTHTLVNVAFMFFLFRAYMRPDMVTEAHSAAAYLGLAFVFLGSIGSGALVLLLSYLLPGYSLLGWAAFPVFQFFIRRRARPTNGERQAEQLEYQLLEGGDSVGGTLLGGREGRQGRKSSLHESGLLTLQKTLKAEAERLVCFTDGVYAVGATLIILDIPPPKKTGNPGDVLDNILENWPGFLAFLFSFSFIYILWTQHHLMFHHIHRVNRTAIRLNGIQLVSISLISYAASLLTHLTHDFDNALRFMCLVLFIAGFTQVALWAYLWSAENGSLRIGHDMSVCVYVAMHVLVLPMSAALVFCLSYLHSYYALLGFLSIPMWFVLLDWLRCADLLGSIVDRIFA